MVASPSEMKLTHALQTRPKTNRLAFYSYLLRRAALGRSSGFGKEMVVEYKGNRFIYGKGHEEAAYSLYLDETEPQTYEYMTNLSGDLFVDLGANVGGYTVRLAKKFREVISVEPNPGAARSLRDDVDLNHLDNVKVVEKAVWDSVGEATLWVPASKKTTRSSITQHFQGGASFRVETVTLDDLTKGYEKVDLIKVDVEGADLAALRGGKETLKRTSRLVIELSPKGEAAVKGILAPLGFRFSYLDTKVNNIRNMLAEMA